MLKKREKLITKLLILAMCTSLLPTTLAFAEEKDSTQENVTKVVQTTGSAVSINEKNTVEEEVTNELVNSSVTYGDYEFDTTTGTITKYVGTDTTVVIPSTINGVSVTSIGQEAFWGYSNLTSITISDSVTSIGSSAFWGCSNLKSITIPDSVTSIGSSVFFECSSLTNITIPNSVKFIDDDYSLFQGCISLTSATIPDGVTSIGEYAFESCSGLTSITIPDSVTSIRQVAFQGCSSLTNITIPESVTSIGDYAFRACDNAIFYVSSERIETLLINTGVDANKIILNGQSSEVNTDYVLKPGETFEIKNNSEKMLHLNIGEGSLLPAEDIKIDITTYNEDGSVYSMGRIGKWTETYVWPNCKTVVTNVSESDLKIEAYAYGVEVYPDDVSYTKTDDKAFEVVPLAINETYTFINYANNATTIGFSDSCYKNIYYNYKEGDSGTGSISDINHLDVDNNMRVDITNNNAETINLYILNSSGIITVPDETTTGAAVSVTSVELDNTSLDLQQGDTSKLTATISPDNASNQDVQWTTSDESIATVDEYGTVTAIGEGSATITCRATDGSEVSATCDITVTVPVTSIELDNTSLDLQQGDTSKLTATISPDNASNQDVEWTTSDESIATVDQDGTVTAIREGSATITCRATDGSEVSATCDVTVTIPVTSIKLNKTSFSLLKGNTSKLTATVGPINATNKAVAWKSSNTKVAIVDANGKVTAVSMGTANITCTAKDGSKIIATCKVTVMNPVSVTNVKLNKTSLSLLKGNTATLTATASPTTATNKAVTWKSSNTKIATVDANGKITAVAKGTAIITSTAKDGSKKSAICKVTVTNPVSVTSIKLNKTSLSVIKGKISTLTATALPSNASNKAVIWKSSNTKIATVDANGKITGVSKGTTNITCTTKDGSKKIATCKVTVANPISVTSIKLNKTSLRVAKGKTATLTATALPSTATNKAVTWKSSNTKIATIDGNGKITGVAKGIATITCTAKDGSKKVATCKVTVTK